jgi:hypothetical protein
MAWRPHQSDENAYQKKEPVGRESEAHPAISSVPRARRRTPPTSTSIFREKKGKLVGV